MLISPKSRYLEQLIAQVINKHVENDDDDDNSNMHLKKKRYECVSRIQLSQDYAQCSSPCSHMNEALGPTKSRGIYSPTVSKDPTP